MTKSENQMTTTTTLTSTLLGKIFLLLRTIILGALIFVGLTAPFTHITQPTFEEGLTSINNEKKTLILNIKKSYTELSLKLKSNQINQSDYAEQYKKLTIQNDLKISSFKSKKTKVKQELKYRGYVTYRYFLYAVGSFITLLILSFRYWYLILKTAQKSRIKRIYLNLEAFAFSYVALYWLVWVFFTKTDFNINAYKITFLILIALVLLIVLFSIKYIIYMENKKLKIIQYLNQEIFVEIKNDFISLFNEGKYREKYFERCQNILNKQINF